MFFHRMSRFSRLSNRTRVGVQIKMSRDIHLTTQARVLIVNLSGVICPVTFFLFSKTDSLLANQSVDP